MEQLKRALMNAAKRQMLKATEQPETASREMQGENEANWTGAAPGAKIGHEDPLVLAVQMEVPMLDEAEYAEVFRLYTDSIQQMKELCREKSLPLGAMPLHEMFKPVRTRFQSVRSFADDQQVGAITQHQTDRVSKACKIVYD
jgi:hypothetical protein